MGSPAAENDFQVPQGYAFLPAFWNNQRSYDFAFESGTLTSAFRENERLYKISNLEVSDRGERRRGVGKGLLRVALGHAESLEARTVLAIIISRECLDAMEAVFGEDSIEVLDRGGYAPEGHDQCLESPTRALLWKQLD
jgi:hypothetical protein